MTISADQPEQRAAAEEFLRQAGVQRAAYLKQAEDDDAFIRQVDPGWRGSLPAVFLYDPEGRRIRSFLGATEADAIEREVRARMGIEESR